MTERKSKPDPVKVFKAIEEIINAREEGVRVRLVSVEKRTEEERKVAV